MTSKPPPLPARAKKVAPPPLPTLAPTPSVGRIVLYKTLGIEYPAIIVGTNGPGLDLQVFCRSSFEPTVYKPAVLEGDGSRIGTWRWPPRVS